MADDDKWVSVGGKGKPRRTAQQQQRHLREREAAAAALAAVTTHQSPRKQLHILQQLERHRAAQAAAQATVALGASPELQQQLLAAAAAAAAAPLPGWDPPEQPSEWKVAGSGGSRRSRKQRQAAAATPEQQVQQLEQQVRDISSQLLHTPMYAALTSAMQQAAASSSRPAAEDQPQPHQGQPPGQGSSSSSGQQAGWQWEAVQQLVVYGLGSVEDSRVSRHQLALVLVLQQLLPGLSQAPLLFDPAFTDIDRLLLARLGLQVIGHNEGGRRPVTERTLFYLPHCEGVLCDNLLAANWSSSQLSQMAILGNSFASYQARWTASTGVRPATKRPDKLLLLVEQGAVLELPVPDHNFHVASAFNDCSLHLFRPSVAALAAGGADCSSPPPPSPPPPIAMVQ